MEASATQQPSSHEPDEPSEGVVELGLHLISGKEVDRIAVEASCTGGDLKRQASKCLGPSARVSKLLVGCEGFRDTDTVDDMGLKNGDVVTVIIGAYCDRVRVIDIGAISSGIGFAWSYANNAQGSMFIGCGDDFRVIPAISGITNAVTFEARGLPQHCVMIQDDVLRLRRLSSDDDYTSLAIACSFRLHFTTEEESSSLQGTCRIESCAKPGEFIGRGRSSHLGVLKASVIPSGVLKDELQIWKIQDPSKRSG